MTRYFMSFLMVAAGACTAAVPPDLAAEDRAEISGALAVMVLDDFTEGKEDRRYQLLSSDPQSPFITLHPRSPAVEETLRAIDPNAAVTVRGSWDGTGGVSKRLVVDEIETGRSLPKK